MNFTDKFIQTLSAFKRDGMSNSNHILVLAILSRNKGGLIMTDLAERIEVSTASVTAIIDALEKLRLVERTRTHDRRKIVVRVTYDGEQFLKRMLG